MDKTKKLREIILSKHRSYRAFAREIDMPITTLMGALEKGIGIMSFDRVLKICSSLNIDINSFEPVDSTFNIENNKTLGNRIKRARLSLEVSTDELAEKINVHESYIISLENGKINNIYIETIRKIALALDVTSDYLLDLSDIEINTSILDRIFKIASLEDISINELCRRIGINYSSLEHFDTSIRLVKYSTVNKISEKFKVNKEWLLYGSGEIYHDKTFLTGDFDNNFPDKYFIAYIDDNLSKIESHALRTIKNIVDANIIE